MWVTDLADVLRDAGLDVDEVHGWRSRGHGPMSGVHGVTCHHTGGVDDLRVIVDGRPDLDGPLAQLWLSRGGVFHVVAAGRCWHAGVSRKSDYTNSWRLGVEAEAYGDGRASDWPAAQMSAYRRGCLALSKHYRFPVSEILGHKETCAPKGRKTDPNFDMRKFRNEIREGDKSVALTSKEIDAIARRILTLDAIDAPHQAPDHDTNPHWRLDSYIRDIDDRVRTIETLVRSLHTR